MKICIDPGHNASGADTGAEGNGLREQDLTLDIALRLKALLEFNGLSVVMTRTGDFVNGPHGNLFESLASRVNIANAAGVDLFVSIHINSFTDHSANGSQVFIYGKGGLAEKLAGKVAPRIAAAGFSNRGVTVANFQVLRETSMPAILTENGFISNSNDAAKLREPKFRHALAAAHARGLCIFAGVEYREPETAPDTKTQAIEYLEKALQLLKG